MKTLMNFLQSIWDLVDTLTGSESLLHDPDTRFDE
jgi:hypothetical protein